MGLSHEHLGPKLLAKFKIDTLTRAELLCPLCYEIPCTIRCYDLLLVKVMVSQSH